MSETRPGWPNPFCLQCRARKACEVHAAMPADALQPDPHCYDCNSGEACDFHAKPEHQKFIQAVLQGEDPDLDAAKKRPKRKKQEPPPEESDEYDIFAPTETAEQARARISRETHDPASAPYALSPELEAKRQALLAKMDAGFRVRDAIAALNLHTSIPTPEQLKKKEN